MRLTKEYRKRIESALYHANRAQRYLDREDTVVAHRSHGTTTLDYVRVSDGKALQEVEKDYGSDLCGLRDTIRDLVGLLEMDIQEQYRRNKQ